MKSSALREPSGSDEICLTLTVVATAVEAVWTISAPASTTIVSDNSPTCSATRTVPGMAAASATSFATHVLNPISDTVTV